MYVNRFEWDAEKARANRSKHGIDFADAVTILDDANALTLEQVVDAEQRFITLGSRRHRADSCRRLRVSRIRRSDYFRSQSNAGRATPVLE